MATRSMRISASPLDSRKISRRSIITSCGQFVYVSVLREAFHEGAFQEAREFAAFNVSRGSTPPTGGSISCA
jgi:hypothetical protein